MRLRQETQPMGKHTPKAATVAPCLQSSGSTPRLKTRQCEECAHADYSGELMKCGKGHRPRFYLPKGNYPYDEYWGWKRRCADFKAGQPAGIRWIKFEWSNDKTQP